MVKLDADVYYKKKSDLQVSGLVRQFGHSYLLLTRTIKIVLCIHFWYVE